MPRGPQLDKKKTRRLTPKQIGRILTLYADELYSIPEVARVMRCDNSTVHLALVRHNIPRRNRVEQKVARIEREQRAAQRIRSPIPKETHSEPTTNPKETHSEPKGSPTPAHNEPIAIPKEAQREPISGPTSRARGIKPLTSGFASSTSETHPEEQSKTLQKTNSTRAKNTRARISEFNAEFTEWYAAYPRHIEPRDAEAKYAVLRQSGVPAERLLIAAHNYAAYVEHTGTSDNYVKYPATFLGPKGAWASYAEGVPENRERSNGHDYPMGHAARAMKALDDLERGRPL